MVNDNTTLTDKQADQVAKVILQDGKLLGISIPKPVEAVISPFVADAKKYIANFGGETVKKWLGVGLERINVANHQNIANALGDIVGYILPYVENGINAISYANKHKKNYDELIVKPLATLMKANIESENSNNLMNGVAKIFGKNGLEGNGMYEFAVRAINKSTMDSFQNEGFRMIPNVVTNYGQYLEGELRYAQEIPEERAKNLNGQIEFINNFGNKIAGGLGGLAGQLTKNPDPKNIIDNSSLGIVFEIQRYMHRGSIGVSNKNVESNQVNDIAKEIEKAFQAFQKEQGKEAIPTLKVKAAARVIANELANGEMHPLSLINIIGKGRLLKPSKIDLIEDDEEHSKLKEIITDEVKILSKGSEVNVKEFIEKQNYTIDDVKSHISSSDEYERAVAVILHPESVLIAAGMKKDEMKK
ncbi:MAG: hypothetical protein WCJ33_08855 [Pseudomonadota bacterium]